MPRPPKHGSHQRSRDTRSRDAGPARPRDAAPPRPRDAAPARPRDAAPARPRDAAPTRPRDAAPARPRDTAPARPREAAPARPREAAPARPAGRAGGRPEGAHRSGPQQETSARRTGEVCIYGHHPVAAVLANEDRKILRLVATPEAAEKLKAEAGIPARTLGQLKIVARREVDDLAGESAVHQGVAVLARTLDYNLTDVLERLAEQASCCIVVLDQVTDPHNVGAILRSATAFGASAVVAPDRHAPDETGAMAKSASGALDKIPYVKAGNLVRALEELKEHRFWLVGLDADAPQHLAQVKLDGRIALVLGAEGEGLRRLVRETCDHVARLPMAGGIESLNVSNAGAVALYERARQNKT